MIYRLKAFSGTLLCSAMALTSTSLLAADYTSSTTYSINGKTSVTASDSTLITGDNYNGTYGVSSDHTHSTVTYDTYGYDVGSSRSLAYSTLGGLGTYSVSAIQTILDTYTNTTSTAVNAAVNLSLLGSLLYEAPTATSADSGLSSVTYSVLANGVSIWSSTASLLTQGLSTTLSQSSTALDYSADTNSSFSSYSLDQSLQVALGTIAAGQTVNLAYTITALASANNVGTFSTDTCSNGYYFNAGCPGGSLVEGNIMVNGITTSAVPVASAVPEAPTSTLWFAGLGCISAAAWRRRTWGAKSIGVNRVSSVA